MLAEPEAVTQSQSDPVSSPPDPVAGQTQAKAQFKQGTAPGTARYYFSSANAKAMAERSAKARAKRKLAKAMAPTTPEPVPAPITAIPNPELELVEEQITRIRQQLLEDMEPTERAQLVRALDLMLDRKRMILMIPGPGTYRPTAQPKASRIQSLLGPDE